jgi:hypothetical protein
VVILQTYLDSHKESLIWVKMKKKK